MIPMSNWTFTTGGGRLAAIGVGPPPTTLSFASHRDLLVHLASGKEVPSGQIERRLKAGAKSMGWPKTYTRLGAAPHFRRYRQTPYFESYKQAAIAVTNGTASPQQVTLVKGLSSEIGSSAVTVPAGQVLFHGRSDLLPSKSANYPAFLSTTLNPQVARQSSFRRKATNGGRETVYAFTLQRDLPAMWGHVGQSGEWELLLDRDLPVSVTAQTPGVIFDIIEADLG